MKRVTVTILSLFVFAAILDYCSSQGIIGKEKLYKNYYEDGRLNEEKYFPKLLQLRVKQGLEISNFHKVRLRSEEDVLIDTYPLKSESGEHKFDLWNELEGGRCRLEVLDNFGELYSKPITINYIQTQFGVYLEFILEFH